MVRLLLWLFAVLAYACLALAHSTHSHCVSDYGAAHQGFPLCGTVSETLVRDVARNCTGGDIEGATTALAAYCGQAELDDTADQTTLDAQDLLAEHLSRVVLRRSSDQKRSEDATDSAEESTVEPQRWQSSSTTYKHQSWALKTEGSPLSNLFAERSVRFALSGLLFTTLTSFLFL